MNNINIQLVVYRVFPKREDLLFVQIGCMLQLILKDYLQMSGRLVSYDALVIAFARVNFTTDRNFTLSCQVSYLYGHSTAKPLPLLTYASGLYCNRAHGTGAQTMPHGVFPAEGMCAGAGRTF